MTRWPREFQDEDCGCAWRSDAKESLCARCWAMREDHEADKDEQEKDT